MKFTSCRATVSKAMVLYINPLSDQDGKEAKFYESGDLPIWEWTMPSRIGASGHGWKYLNGDFRSTRVYAYVFFFSNPFVLSV